MVSSSMHLMCTKCCVLNGYRYIQYAYATQIACTSIISVFVLCGVLCVCVCVCVWSVCGV